MPAWVLDLLDAQPTDSVPEVGHGPGLGLQLAAARTHQGRVAGVDRSETVLKIAYRRNRTLIEAGRIELHPGAADRLPFDDATFDKTITINSHHIWPDMIAGLRQIRRTLRAGGRVAIAITRFSYASTENFETLLIEAGFKEVRLHTGEPETCAMGRA